MAYKAQDFLDAIPGSGGVISAIADKVGCEWHTVQRAIDRYPTVKEAYDDECHRVSDKAKHNIIKAVHGGDLPTSKWYLQMKDPEFMPRQRTEVTGKDGQPITIVNWENAADNQD